MKLRHSILSIKMFILDDTPKRQWGSHKILAFHTKGCIYMRMLLMIAFNRTTFIPEPTQITIFVENYSKLPATEIVDIFGQRWLQRESHLTRVWVEGRSVETDFRLCLQRNALLARQCMYYIVYQPMHCNVCSVICSITFPANQAMYIRGLSAPGWQLKPIGKCHSAAPHLARLQDYLAKVSTPDGLLPTCLKLFHPSHFILTNCGFLAHLMLWVM